IGVDTLIYENFYNIEGKEAVEQNKLNLKHVIWLSVYRRSFLEEHNISFLLELRTGQDNIFNLHASYFANKVIYTQLKAYYYRVVRDGSLMTQFNHTDQGL